MILPAFFAGLFLGCLIGACVVIVATLVSDTAEEAGVDLGDDDE